MVTLDKIVYNVRPFDGDISRRRDYERAVQGIELIDERMGMLEARLKAETGYDEMNLPSGPRTTPLWTKGGYGASFEITSTPTTKRPKYKDAVIGMENYLKGRSYLANVERRAITGMLKVNNSYFMDAGLLLETFSSMIAGIMVPQVRHQIKYETDPVEVPESMDLSKNIRYDSAGLNTYVVMDMLRKKLVTFVKAYEKKLGKKKIKPVNTRSGYKITEEIASGTDWAYVVKKLIQEKDDKERGELNLMVDPTISLAMKRRMMPHFEMIYHTPQNDERKVYVSLASVYDRIQHLKDAETITSRRERVENIDIV